MISSREDYEFYLEADRLALGIKRKKPMIVGDEIWIFQRLLRKVEYFSNCKNFFIWKPYYYFIWLKFHILSILLGFTITPNVFGLGLSIGHRGTIVVNGKAKIGANCRIHVCVSIGTKAGYSDKAPIIGDNVYIGPGVKLFGEIYVADGIAIGANSVVNKSFYERNITIGGIPAKKISDKGSDGLVIKATEILSSKSIKKESKEQTYE